MDFQPQLNFDLPYGRIYDNLAMCWKSHALEIGWKQGFQPVAESEMKRKQDHNLRVQQIRMKR